MLSSSGKTVPTSCHDPGIPAALLPLRLPFGGAVATIASRERSATSLLSYVVLGITLGFAAGVQPGPFQTFLISRTLQDGWRHSLPAACAPLLSDIPAVTLALLLLTSLPVWMENTLYFAGGFFVLFLAYRAFKSFKNYTFSQTVLLQSGRQNFLKAVTVNLLNPSPYLFWSLVTGPLLLRGWREGSSQRDSAGFQFLCHDHLDLRRHHPPVCRHRQAVPKGEPDTDRRFCCSSSPLRLLPVVVGSYIAMVLAPSPLPGESPHDCAGEFRGHIGYLRSPEPAVS